MKILYIVNIPSPYRVSFFNELGKLCELTVLYERQHASDREWIPEKALNFREIYLKGINFGKDTALCFDVLSYLKKKSYDIIVIGGYSTPTGMIAIEYMSMKRIPFVLNCDGGYVKNTGNARDKIKEYFISKAQSWLSPSKITDKYLINYGADDEKIYRYSFTSLYTNDILKSPLDISEKRRYKKELNIGYDKIIISVGQFIYRKGYDVLLRACENLEKDIGVYIIGGLPTEDYLNIEKEYGLKNIEYIPFKEKNELKKYYMSADLFVLPTREDIWGLVINEAMAMGLPIITTDKCVAGLELVKNDLNGYIIPNEDIKILAEKMISILNNDSKRKSMSMNAINTISKYTFENMAYEHIKIFENIINMQ